MTPLVTTDTDQLRSMTTFRTSTIYELCLSLGALRNPGHRHQMWAEKVRAQLPQDLLEDIEFLYSRFENGILLMELAIDYPEHHNVEGFCTYVERMSRAEFLFYVLGRLAPREEMAQLEPTMESLLSIIPRAYPEGCPYTERRLRTGGFLKLVADPEGHQRRLTSLWRRYWQLFFKEESKRYHQIWEDSIEEKSLAFSRQDPLDFLRKLTNKSELPDQIPPGYTTQEVILVPCHFAPHHLMFYGYGSITVLYDCRITEQRRQELEMLQEELVNTAKALQDKTRLELLKWIVRDPHTYGRKLAQICHISQPSVSRHLRVLKEAGIIEEKRIENHITYDVQREQIENLSHQLIAYLYE